MKKTLLLCTALLALTAPVAFAGLDLTWNGCNLSTLEASSVTFDCTAGSTNPYHLYGCFQSATALPTFFAMDISIDLQINDDPGLPSWWHFEPGGCNASGLALSAAQPSGTTICPAASHGNLWGTNGGHASAIITAYQPGFGGANRARLNMTINRASSDPVMVNACQNYFAFDLLIFMDNAVEDTNTPGTCVGCPKSSTIAWSSATLFSTAVAGLITPEVTSTTITGPGLVSNSVRTGPAVPPVPWVSDGVAVHTGPHNQTDPAITSDNQGGAIIAWTHNPSCPPSDI
jgi:hypothetical protein